MAEMEGLGCVVGVVVEFGEGEGILGVVGAIAVSSGDVVRFTRVKGCI